MHKSVNFDLDEVERNRQGPMTTKGAIPSNKAIHSTLSKALAAHQQGKQNNKSLSFSLREKPG